MFLRKERSSLRKLKDSAAMRGCVCQSVLCGEIRRADIRDLIRKEAHTFPDMSNLTDLNALYDAFRASMKDSAWKEEPQHFEADWLSELVSLKHDIESRTYQILPGIEFTLNERGKIRHIHGSRIRDRVARHVLCDNEIDPMISKYLIYNNGASQKGKGLAFARSMFEKDLHNFYLEYGSNDGYIGFVDFSKFYDNIRHDKIKELLYPIISEEARWLVDIILAYFEVDVSYMSDDEYAGCMERKHNSVAYYETVSKEQRTGEKFMAKGVDIGDQFSQSIGVFFPTQIDNYVKIVRGCKRYGRYMDDMYIICKDKAELQSVIDGIREQADALGLFINSKKTRIVKLSGVYKFLQIKYTLSETGRVIRRINPRNVTRERRRLKAYRRLIDAGKMQYADVEQASRSWMGEYSKLMSKKQIDHMKTLYKALFGKELSWKPKSSTRTARK